MGEKNNNPYIEALKFGLNPTGYLVQKGTEALIMKAQSLRETGTVGELEEEAIKQDIYTQMSEAQARIAQELAIAQRINTADEVEIEEYYEGEGNGGIGVQATQSNINIGVSGHGRKVVKRVYKFKGWNEKGLEVIEKHNKESDLLSDS
ncbi:hypothetical protein FZD47_20220 [Bacillus infantis]|uniref:Uncharacterized protein n=1 Tax=Bacillus infantis TaxID=324767 RepID=A0A5D4SB92_9BACI|nr:hypothetical protein [Bacillus infantis]TYS60540.1 hypothetical protein FZD47_20220 [Bacillus infantis]